MKSSTTFSTRKKVTPLFPLVTLLLANGLISLIFMFFAKNNSLTFIKNGEPTCAISHTLLFWLTFGMVICMGLVPFMQFSVSGYKTDRSGLSLNYSLFYLHFLLFLMWAMFTYFLSLPVAGCIVLGVAICVSIFICYRFITNSIIAGSIFTIWCLWLIYVFILNLAYVLL